MLKAIIITIIVVPVRTEQFYVTAIKSRAQNVIPNTTTTTIIIIIIAPMRLHLSPGTNQPHHPIVSSNLMIGSLIILLSLN